MDDFGKIFDKTLRFLSFRPRSEKEIRLYLKRKTREIPSEIIERIVTRLKELNFLNDKEFALWWYDQRTTAKPKGKSLVKRELAQKGIGKDIIEELFADKARQDPERDFLLAEKLAAKKLLSIKANPVEKIRKKLFSHLSYRGFSYGAIKQAIDSLIGKDYNDNEAN